MRLPRTAWAPITARYGHGDRASKGWNIPGLKSAQLILTDDRDQSKRMDRDIVPSQAGSILGAVAATAAYLDGVDWLDETVKQFRVNRDLLASTIADTLPGARMVVPEGTDLGWIDFRALAGGTSPADRILDEAGIAPSDGVTCGEAGRGIMRLNFAMDENVLRHAVTRVRLIGVLRRP